MNIEALMQQQIFVVNAFCHQGQGGNGQIIKQIK